MPEGSSPPVMRIVPSWRSVVVAPERVPCGWLARLHEPAFRNVAEVAVTADGAVASRVKPGLPALAIRKPKNVAVPVASVATVVAPASVTAASVVHAFVARDIVMFA